MFPAYVRARRWRKRNFFIILAAFFDQSRHMAITARMALEVFVQNKEVDHVHVLAVATLDRFLNLFASIAVARVQIEFAPGFACGCRIRLPT